ncbi:MAG: hypothetical protein HF300_15800 [Ignavibacteria bacterium]|nr:hypothetical protein [Ignavibacteria bacterium]MCU7526223.1 hypothetical protein [Ignavibacteria bacterium]
MRPFITDQITILIIPKWKRNRPQRRTSDVRKWFLTSIVQLLKLESLELEELKRGPEIFKSYYESVTNIFESEKKDEIRAKKLDEFLDELNKKYPLEKNMEELSLKFKAEEFFQEITSDLRGG